MDMIYEIIYDGVLRKAATEPPNEFIGNVEMAAGIGIVLKEIDREIDLSDIKEPTDFKEKFLNIMKDYDMEKLSDNSRNIVGQIMKYKVKRMVNETMEDLEILVKYQI